MKASCREGQRRTSLITASLGSVLAVFILVASPAMATTSTSVTSTTPSTTVTATSTTTSTTTKTTTTTTTTTPVRSKLVWPKQGSAAVSVPQLSVVAVSRVQPRVPIASLTKMMTAWVVLHRYPLTFARQGHCLTVNANDVALYHHDVVTGQSNVEIKEGVRLCEGTLMRGLLVHSAGDYGQLLVALMRMSKQQFVAVMNRDAAALGLRHTHYADYTGISPRSVSTAHDQAILAVDLMTHESIVRRIVALTKVALPVAGVVTSYTPFVGRAGVVGVKSGFTTPAGGCDVMAIHVSINHSVITTYAVVLGQHSADPLASAGQAALALSRSLRASIARVVTPSGVRIEWIGSPRDIVTSSPR